MEIKVSLPGLELKNPIMPASGCFSKDYAEYYDLKMLGAILTKAITLKERIGNPPSRTIETSSGMLNAIGLQNPGIDSFIENELPWLEQLGVPVIANVSGSTEEEYVEVCKRISEYPCIKAIELNISCPNVLEGGITFGTDVSVAYTLTKKVKAVSSVPVYVKLTPNVTNIVTIAQAVEDAGADGISMINTLLGMKINLQKGESFLANITGGLSGPAIKPIAIRMIYQVYNKVKIPIIGVGGIQSAEDVLEFLYAGASAVEIGTGNFINPYMCRNIINELPAVLEKYGHKSAEEAVGYIYKKK